LADAKIAVEYQLRSLAFPAISCGVFGYPIDQAAEIAVREIAVGLAANESLENVTFPVLGKRSIPLTKHGWIDCQRSAFATLVSEAIGFSPCPKARGYCAEHTEV
jgi:Macro domain